MRLSAEDLALFAECAPARELFAVGRQEEAIAALAGSAAFRGQSPDEIRRRVAMLHMEDLDDWAGRNAELLIPVGPPSKPTRTVTTYVVDKGEVAELPLSYAEAQPQVAVLKDLTFLLGSSMAMTPDDSLVRIAPRWGKRMKFLENVPGIIGWTVTPLKCSAPDFCATDVLIWLKASSTAAESGRLSLTPPTSVLCVMVREWSLSTTG